MLEVRAPSLTSGEVRRRRRASPAFLGEPFAKPWRWMEMQGLLQYISSAPPHSSLGFVVPQRSCPHRGPGHRRAKGLLHLSASKCNFARPSSLSLSFSIPGHFKKYLKNKNQTEMKKKI